MRKLDPEERRARKNAGNRAWRESKKDELNAARAKWRAENKAAISEQNRRQKFGLSDVEAQAMLDAQGGGCAVCRVPLALVGRSANVDHDHDTDQVRGLLCRPCNLAIGQMKDSPARLRAAAAYLEMHRPKLRLVR